MVKPGNLASGQAVTYTVRLEATNKLRAKTVILHDRCAVGGSRSEPEKQHRAGRPQAEVTRDLGPRRSLKPAAWGHSGGHWSGRPETLWGPLEDTLK